MYEMDKPAPPGRTPRLGERAAAGRRVRVDDLDSAVAALEAARAAGQPARLESPEAAAGRQGIGWWQALLDEASRQVPGVAVDAVLDCGSAPGHALAALAAGVPQMRLDCDGPARAALAAMAARRGARLLGPGEDC